MKTRVIFDIETSGFPIENFDEAQYEYLMKFVDEEETEERRERERAKVIERLNLYPLDCASCSDRDVECGFVAGSRALSI
jgi:hypothetical protein